VSADPWEKAYVYGRGHDGQVAHITGGGPLPLCESSYMRYLNRTPKPYPVCKNCLRTKRAKELGLLKRPPNLRPTDNSELP
jgi:hypothetical protein